MAGDLAAVFSPVTGRAEVFFRGEDGDLHNYTFRGGKWVHQMPNANPGIAKIRIAGRITAAWSDKLQGVEILTMGDDGTLHYFLVKNGAWTHKTL